MRSLFYVVMSLSWVACGPCGCLLNPVVCERSELFGDAGTSAGGSAVLDGGAAYPVATATFTGSLSSDGGLDLTAVSVRLAEQHATCLQGTLVATGQDAGPRRVIQLDLFSTRGELLRPGTYRWPDSSDGGYTLSVKRFTTPRGVLITSGSAALELTTSTQQTLAGTFNATFEGDGESTSGRFDAIRCNPY